MTSIKCLWACDEHKANSNQAIIIREMEKLLRYGCQLGIAEGRGKLRRCQRSLEI